MGLFWYGRWGEKLSPFFPSASVAGWGNMAQLGSSKYRAASSIDSNEMIPEKFVSATNTSMLVTNDNFHLQFNHISLMYSSDQARSYYGMFKVVA